MSIVDGGSPSNLIERVREILLQPKPTWEKIEAEPATVQGLYTGYVAILALIPALAGLLFKVMFSPFLGLGGLTALIGALVETAISYGLSLAGVYAFAWIADQLAVSFGATRNLIQTLKVAAFGITAAWVSSVALVVPLLGGLVVLAGVFYTIYLLHLGLVQLTKPPADKAVAYTAATVVLTGMMMFAAYSILGIVT
jgi:hypothetical protein